MQRKHRIVGEMVARLEASAADRLLSVVVYGPAAHGDYLGEKKNHNLLVVLSDLSLASIAKIGGPVRWWLKKGEPMPRVFSPEFIAEAADVFPMEFLDITAHHEVVHGFDALNSLAVKKHHLRTQCERELRECLMRLQEAYMEAGGKPKKLLALLRESYPVFATVFRGCLQLVDQTVPAHDADVVRDVCRHMSLDPVPFAEVDQIKNGNKLSSSPDNLFQRYYQQITMAIAAFDRLQTENGETT
jgi:hypothetical protein